MRKNRCLWIGTPVKIIDPLIFKACLVHIIDDVDITDVNRPESFKLLTIKIMPMLKILLNESAHSETVEDLILIIIAKVCVVINCLEKINLDSDLTGKITQNSHKMIILSEQNTEAFGDFLANIAEMTNLNQREDIYNVLKAHFTPDIN